MPPLPRQPVQINFDQRAAELAAAPMPAPPRVIRSEWMRPVTFRRPGPHRLAQRSSWRRCLERRAAPSRKPLARLVRLGVSTSDTFVSPVDLRARRTVISLTPIRLAMATFVASGVSATAASARLVRLVVSTSDPFGSPVDLRAREAPHRSSTVMVQSRRLSCGSESRDPCDFDRRFKLERRDLVDEPIGAGLLGQESALGPNSSQAKAF